MEALLVLAVFFGSWFGFGQWAKHTGKSKTIGIGGGFIVACIATLVVGYAVSPELAPQSEPMRKKVITATEYGDKWPLKVQQAAIGCDHPHILYLEVGEKIYALNGKALSAGLPRGDEIAKNGNAVEMSVFIQPAMALCPTPP